MLTSEKIYRSIIGFALGDAYGLPFELEAKYQATLHNDNEEMLGYGSHSQPAGTWSDDTSMVIATMDVLRRWNTLIDLNKGEFSEEILHNLMSAFSRWRNEGTYGCHNECFDVGFTTDCAIKDYEEQKDLLNCGQKEEFNCGNGSLMRILPLAFLVGNFPVTKRYIWSKTFSDITHAHPLTALCCFIYVELILGVISGKTFKESYDHAIESTNTISREGLLRQFDIGKCKAILTKQLAASDIADIKNTGYVVDTLEAVIWCLLMGKDFQSSVHLAVSLGNDTDTTAALVGAIASLMYNDPFPHEWMAELKNSDLLISISAKFIHTFLNK